MRREYTWIEDVVIQNDPNKEVKGHVVKIHNQGSTIVRVGEEVLLPDDMIEVSPPPNDPKGIIFKRLRISFLGAFNFNNPLINYPQLWAGDRLLISELKQVGIDG